MALKVTFDSATRTIIPIGPVDDSGLIQLNVQVDLYSDGKEDWLADAALNRFRLPIEAIGGQPIPGGALGTTYILVNGWRLAPDLNLTFTVPGPQAGSLPVYGDGGLNEKLKTGPFIFEHRSVTPWSKTLMRKVGNPTDAFKISLKDINNVLYAEDSIAGEQITTVFDEHFVAYENAALIPFGTSLHYHLERTGVRDEVNYYEVAYAVDVESAFGDTIVVSNGADEPAMDEVLMGTLRIDVPYTLNINGNLFTDTGDPIALPALNVNVQQQVSTLVELRELYEQALEDIRKVMLNAFQTDPVAGVLTVYDDDGTTPIFTADIWEDIAKTQRYRGQGIERRDPLG